MNDPIRIKYSFQFRKSSPIEIDLQIDAENLQCIAWRTVSAPVWVNLDFEQCGNCPLDPKKQPYCPLAARLLQVVQAFSNRNPADEVELTVRTIERTFNSVTSLQDALRSLVGIIMPCSGCPHLAVFRPMARFHLPVGSLAETIYRSTSMYMLAQFFKNDENSLHPIWWGARWRFKTHAERHFWRWEDALAGLSRQINFINWNCLTRSPNLIHLR